MRQAAPAHGDEGRQPDRLKAHQRQQIRVDVRDPRHGRLARRLVQAAPHRLEQEGQAEQPRQDGSGHQGQAGDAARKTEFAEIAPGFAGVDDQRLHPALLPAHPLTEPVAEFVRRLLHGLGIECAHAGPNRESRRPRSTSSVTFQASQPPTRRRTAVRKWLVVPPSASGRSKRREAVSEANANADIASGQQALRTKEFQLNAERILSDRQREMEQTRAANAVLIAEAEAKRQEALGLQRVAELQATEIAQAGADAEKVRIAAEAQARAEAVRITTLGEANAESIRKINEAVQAGGENYLRYRQIEMLPQIAPAIAEALAKAKLVTINSGGADGAAGSTTENISGVIRTVLAAQLVSRSGMLGTGADGINQRPVLARTEAHPIRPRTTTFFVCVRSARAPAGAGKTLRATEKRLRVRSGACARTTHPKRTRRHPSPDGTC